MFLLLPFFMLGADMGQRELEDVVLPQSAHAREDDPTKADRDRLTLNVHRRDDGWAIAVRGEDVTAPGALETAIAASAWPDRNVLVRADGDATYEHVQRIMQACGKAGLVRIDLAAARPAE